MKAINCTLVIICWMMVFYSCKKDKNEHLTLILQPDSLTGQDATISNTSQSNDGKSEIIYLSKYYSINTGRSLYSRAVINFDLSSIPHNASIESAFLSLYYPKTGEQYKDNDFCINRIISPWEENTITWETQPQYTDSSLVRLSKSTSPYQDYPNINVTELVCDMLANKDNSFGFLLKLSGEIGGHGGVCFASSNNQDKNLRPKLIVNYAVDTK